MLIKAKISFGNCLLSQSIEEDERQTYSALGSVKILKHNVGLAVTMNVISDELITLIRR